MFVCPLLFGGLVKRLPLLLVLLLALSSAPFARAQDPPIPTGHVRIHYHRPASDYTGWALYTWNASTAGNAWCSSEINTSGTDAFGIYFDVPVNPTQGSPAGDLGFIINNCAAGGVKDPAPISTSKPRSTTKPGSYPATPRSTRRSHLSDLRRSLQEMSASTTLAPMATTLAGRSIHGTHPQPTTAGAAARFNLPARITSASTLMFR